MLLKLTPYLDLIDTFTHRRIRGSGTLNGVVCELSNKENPHDISSHLSWGQCSMKGHTTIQYPLAMSSNVTPPPIGLKTLTLPQTFSDQIYEVTDNGSWDDIAMLRGGGVGGWHWCLPCLRGQRWHCCIYHYVEVSMRWCSQLQTQHLTITSKDSMNLVQCGS